MPLFKEVTVARGGNTLFIDFAFQLVNVVRTPFISKDLAINPTD
ncbi:MAG: hypothetical protein V3R52_07565 [Candidatus Neomarinimicrobiota bacterium]